MIRYDEAGLVADDLMSKQETMRKYNSVVGSLLCHDGCIHMRKHLNVDMTKYLCLGPVYSHSCALHEERAVYTACADFDLRRASDE